MSSFEGLAIGFKVTGVEMGRAGIDNDGFPTPPEVVSISVAISSNSAAVNSIVKKVFLSKGWFLKEPKLLTATSVWTESREHRNVKLKDRSTVSRDPHANFATVVSMREKVNFIPGPKLVSGEVYHIH